MATWILSADPIEDAGVPFGPEEGASASFLGVVRLLENGRPLSGIRYTAYMRMAEAFLPALHVRAVAQRGPHRLHLQHRLGFVPVGEPSLLIRVATRHSQEALDLCAFYLRAVKTELPVWKEPVFVPRETAVTP